MNGEVGPTISAGIYGERLDPGVTRLTPARDGSTVVFLIAVGFLSSLVTCYCISVSTQNTLNNIKARKSGAYSSN